MHKIIWLFVGILGVSFLSANIASASNPEVSESHSANTLASGKHVDLHLTLNEIAEISVGHGSYLLDATLLLVWNETQTANFSSISPIVETLVTTKLDERLEEIWHPEFAIANQLSPRQEGFRRLVIREDGTHELTESFRAPLELEPEMPGYPFGNLDLYISIHSIKETIKELSFRAVSFELADKSAENIIRGNWSFSNATMVSNLDHHLGHRSAEGFSAAEFHFNIHHDFADGMQKIIIPILLIITISIIIQVLSSLRFGTNADWRIGGQLTLVLTIMALKFSVADDLPKTHYLTLADALFFVSIIITSLNLLTSTYVNYLFQRRSEAPTIVFETRMNIFLVIITILSLATVFLITT